MSLRHRSRRRTIEEQGPGAWRSRQGSNLRPSGSKPDALSTELRDHEAVDTSSQSDRLRLDRAPLLSRTRCASFSRAWFYQAMCRERVVLLDRRHDLHRKADCGPNGHACTHSRARGAPFMDLLPSYPEFYPLLLGIMALSTLALPLMVWWSERR